jgi:hypothetical protein
MIRDFGVRLVVVLTFGTGRNPTRVRRLVRLLPPVADMVCRPGFANLLRSFALARRSCRSAKLR